MLILLSLLAMYMFHVILYQPEIPPNTGNIIRLCANTNCKLHLIEPLGFNLDEKPLRRAGLDYHDLVNVNKYPNYLSCVKQNKFQNIYMLSSKANRNYTDVTFTSGDAFLFGKESSGLPDDIRDKIQCNNQIKLPQYTSNRSLNLSNTVAIMVYEAWRQNDFR
jgi:tRNA (cytidine/uridine-2'-O-)-methyltransferase